MSMEEAQAKAEAAAREFARTVVDLCAAAYGPRWRQGDYAVFMRMVDDGSLTYHWDWFWKPDQVVEENP